MEAYTNVVPVNLNGYNGRITLKYEVGYTQPSTSIVYKNGSNIYNNSGNFEFELTETAEDLTDATIVFSSQIHDFAEEHNNISFTLKVLDSANNEIGKHPYSKTISKDDFIDIKLYLFFK